MASRSTNCCLGDIHRLTELARLSDAHPRRSQYDDAEDPNCHTNDGLCGCYLPDRKSKSSHKPFVGTAIYAECAPSRGEKRQNESLQE
jgi:hypothetical protein